MYMASTSNPSASLPELPQRFVTNKKISFSTSFEKTQFFRKSKNAVRPRIVDGCGANFRLRCSVADVDSTQEKSTPAHVEVKTWYPLSLLFFVISRVRVSLRAPRRLIMC